MTEQYTQIFKNAVYAKDKSVTVGDEELLLKQLVLIKRYTEATEDEVVEYLKQKADELGAAASLIIPGHERPNRSPLENAIMQLPEKVIRDLKTGDEDCIKFVRQNTEAPVVKEDEPKSQYLHVRYGLVPAKIIETNQEAGNIKEAGWYDTAFSDDDLNTIGMGKRWNMQMLLSEGVLPELDEMDVLLKHGTHSSKTLEISKVKYPADEVREVMGFVYKSFSTPEQIAQLTDISSNLLEKLASQPINGLHQMVQQSVAAQELMKKMQERGE